MVSFLMATEWAEYAEEWDGNFQARGYADRAFEELVKIAKSKGTRILDFRCNTSLLSEKFSTHADIVVALDSSSKMVARLVRKKFLMSLRLLMIFQTN
jgi:predicted TPR repeat methyltransferase